jgi:energy-converting hydrogenase A subunit R
MEYEGLDDLGFYEGKQFISNCRGLIIKNDNAYQLCCHYVEDGGKFFTVLSKYDDILAYALHRDSYKAGDTLRLILPFLKAGGATDNSMLEFSRTNIDLISGARKTMRYMANLMPSFIISTGYEHNLMAVCDVIDFPITNVYSTSFQLDIYDIDTHERNLLKEYAKEIAAMPVPEIPANATRIRDFSTQDQGIIRRLDDIFWDELRDMHIFDLIENVNPIGGNEKAYSVLDIRRKTAIDIADTMYVGDGITDHQAMDLVRDGGGLAVAFNGNRYALEKADIAVISEDTVVVSILAAAFYHGGKDAAIAIAEGWSKEFLKVTDLIDVYLKDELLRVSPELPEVKVVDLRNIDGLILRSEAFRRKVRGNEVGRLG